MPRTLSYTEVSTALTCFAQWDFAYGGRLSGSTLKPRQIAPILSDGRAWGAGVAAWHATGNSLATYKGAWRSFVEDAEGEREKGYPVDPERTLDQFDALCDILDHYIATAERIPDITRLEGEIRVPIAEGYDFHCYLDGHSPAHMGHPWIVEFKLRASLTPFVIVERQPQYRWYALAWATENKWDGPVGVLVDERLKAAPKPPKINRNGKVSHDKRQYCTVEAYRAACEETGEEPSAEAIGVFESREWRRAHQLVFTPDDLAEARTELETAAFLIDELDHGALYPIRNGKRANCSNCKFTGVCLDTHNDFLITSLYTRGEAKRLLPSLGDQRTSPEDPGSDSVCSTPAAIAGGRDTPAAGSTNQPQGD